MEGRGPSFSITTTFTRSRLFRHLLETLHVRWLLRISDYIPYNYQTDFRWDLSPYGITSLSPVPTGEEVTSFSWNVITLPWRSIEILFCFKNSARFIGKGFTYVKANLQLRERIILEVWVFTCKTPSQSCSKLLIIFLKSNRTGISWLTSR